MIQTALPGASSRKSFRSKHQRDLQAVKLVESAGFDSYDIDFTVLTATAQSTPKMFNLKD